MKRTLLWATYVLMAVFFFSAYGTVLAADGSFWSDFNVPDPGCVTIGTVEVCGPVKVDKLDIIEESTADILGTCSFGDSNTATTGPIAPGYQFWCERGQLGPDGSTDIQVSSNQSNLPMIKAYIVQASSGLPMWETYHQPMGGLQGAGGGTSDPYQNKDWEFAGFKKLTFTTTANKDYNWMRQHALEPLRKAGYTANLHSFTATSPGFTAEIGVYDTLDGRVLMEENVIKKEGWKVKSGEGTRGNRGTYEYTLRYKGTAKATLSWPAPFQNYKFWEINAEVTFEKDPNSSTEEADVYITSEGTITQTMYTGTPVCPGPKFTDTYPIFPGDGILYLRPGTDPIQYQADASISALTPIEEKSYTWCCPPGENCQNETLTRSAQEHQWLDTGDSDQTAQSGGTLQGTYVDPNIIGSYYEWNFKSVDNPSPQSPGTMLLLLGD